MHDDKVIKGKWRPLCRAHNCEQGERTAGYCPRHYQQVRRHGRLTPEREYGHRQGLCKAEDCCQAEVARQLDKHTHPHRAVLPAHRGRGGDRHGLFAGSRTFDSIQEVR